VVAPNQTEGSTHQVHRVLEIVCSLYKGFCLFRSLLGSRIVCHGCRAGLLLRPTCFHDRLDPLAPGMGRERLGRALHSLDEALELDELIHGPRALVGIAYAGQKGWSRSGSSRCSSQHGSATSCSCLTKDSGQSFHGETDKAVGAGAGKGDREHKREEEGEKASGGLWLRSTIEAVYDKTGNMQRR
jgi:hypothetical protein